jgi:hypothetical protein
MANLPGILPSLCVADFHGLSSIFRRSFLRVAIDDEMDSIASGNSRLYATSEIVAPKMLSISPK